MADEVETKITRDIKTIVSDVLKEASGIEKGRRNELRKDLTVSLNSMANRIDRGYNIEIRVEEIGPPSDEEDEKSMSAEERKRRDIVEKIRAKQENLKFANVTGQPILTLPESTTGTSTGPKRSTEGSRTASQPRRTRAKGRLRRSDANPWRTNASVGADGAFGSATPAGRNWGRALPSVSRL